MRIYKAIAAFLVCWAAAHLVLTLLYVLPGNMVPLGLKNKASVYMRPVFDQSWGLFAPVPEVNKKLFYCVEDSDGNLLPWRQFYAEYLRDYQSNRFSPRGKFILALSNTLHYLYGENKEKLMSQNLYEGNRQSGYFNVMKHLVSRELKRLQPAAKRIKLMVVYQTTNKNSQTYCLYYPAFELY